MLTAAVRLVSSATSASFSPAFFLAGVLRLAAAGISSGSCSRSSSRPSSSSSGIRSSRSSSTRSSGSSSGSSLSSSKSESLRLMSSGSRPAEKQRIGEYQATINYLITNAKNLPRRRLDCLIDLPWRHSAVDELKFLRKVLYGRSG